MVGEGGRGRRAALQLQAGQGMGTSREAQHDTPVKASFLQDKGRCKLTSVRLLSESWFYRKAGSSCGEKQMSLMVFISDTSNQWPRKKKGLGF